MTHPYNPKQSVAEKIKQRRLQMIVHSAIYYILNDNIISDAQWSQWANELKVLQENYPDIAAQVEYAEYFKDWDASTGFNLPINEDWALIKARQLLRSRDKHSI